MSRKVLAPKPFWLKMYSDSTLFLTSSLTLLGAVGIWNQLQALWLPRPLPPTTGAALECDCGAELREIIHARDLLEWWRLLAVVLGCVAFFLGSVLTFVVWWTCGVLSSLCWCCRRIAYTRGRKVGDTEPLLGNGPATATPELPDFVITSSRRRKAIEP